jgi:hypothetical protein
MSNYEYNAAEYMGAHGRSGSDPISFDSNGVRVYPVYIPPSSDVTEFGVKTITDKKISEKFDEVNRGRESFTFYTYENIRVNVDYWLKKYIEGGGKFLFESEVKQIKFDYLLCPICQDLVRQIIRV